MKTWGRLKNQRNNELWLSLFVFSASDWRSRHDGVACCCHLKVRVGHSSVLPVWQNYETLHYGGWRVLSNNISLQSERNTHPSCKLMDSKWRLSLGLLWWRGEGRMWYLIRQKEKTAALFNVQAGTQTDITVIPSVSSSQVFCWTNISWVMSLCTFFPASHR